MLIWVLVCTVPRFTNWMNCRRNRMKMMRMMGMESNPPQILVSW